MLVHDIATPSLSERSEHHLFRVLRVNNGDLVTVTNGRGSWRPCRASGSTLQPDGDIEYVDEPLPAVELFVAIPKQDRPEWLVQKAKELGVDRIVLLHAERSVVRWTGERAGRHLAKLAIVAQEAAMQSRRVRVPVVEGPVDASSILGTSHVATPGGRPIAPGDPRLAIGPEGGWSDAEVDRSLGAVDLGPHVLRVETAALAAATLLVAGRMRSPRHV
ncbi:16S rRNA (uracil(1498)-N(3))-methyltransferase [soil metagenome]